MSRLLFLSLIAGTVLFGQEYTQGTLRRMDHQGHALSDCPLKHTSVQAEISGMSARVNVEQEFQNPLNEKIEAVYVFPLPHGAAVDRMTMLVGSRVVQGKIKRREEARALYEAAKNAGQTASLLDQERPNIFTQSVANILPGDSIKITISYIETLKYEDGDYEFVFPMVVGPRYVPAGTDGSRITPPVAPEGTRAGHDISIAVSIDAGLPLGDIASKTHPIDLQRTATNRALVSLRDQSVIPNKDFVLRFETAGRTIQDAVLAHASAKGSFFTLILQPPERAGAEDATPKELIFVLDTSGSMSGFPIEKAKEAMKLALAGLHPRDTFNLITFSGDTEILFPETVPASPENVAMAQLFMQSRTGGGGTEMMKAIRAALEPSGAAGRVRVVCFMTDGYVGNDMEIISEVQKHPEARVFSFGIGNSVNRFLLDKMAEYGRGEVEYVGLKDDGSVAARRFHQRVRDPLLTGITIDWGGLPVTEVYPKRIPDLFGAKPVMVIGRYSGAARGQVRLRGNAGGNEVVRAIALNLPASEDANEALSTLWARSRVADLASQDYTGAQQGNMREDVKLEITNLGLQYGLMTQFTAFVAIEEVVVTEAGQPKRIEVPVNMPEGVSHEGVFGRNGGRSYQYLAAQSSAVQSITVSASMASLTPGISSGGGVGDRSGAEVRAKLDPALTALRKSKGKKAIVEIRILLRDGSAATIDSLRTAGLEVLQAPERDLMVTGRIAVAKLKALAKLDAVRYIVQLRR